MAVIREPRRNLRSPGFETLRRTSVFERVAAVMRLPTIRGRKSRTMVSTSGSSGTGDLPPGDISAPMHPGERHQPRSRPARFGGPRDVRADPRDVQDPAARHLERAVLVLRRTGVKEDLIFRPLLGQPDRFAEPG